MRAVKRSAARAAPVVLLLAALTGCGSPAGGDTAGSGESLGLDPEPVAVLADFSAWTRGVHAHPLKKGESLLFDFGSARSPEWTMTGVPYPLVLVALDDDGDELGRLRMDTCKGVCDPVRLEETARYWLEVRPNKA